ncbi:hypothetical protein B0H11DRAFT_2232242 [Mycena galericulata]|nr:hypothetical protein B0H11DRAFT_2232242 [Mycena galericulata]
MRDLTTSTADCTPVGAASITKHIDLSTPWRRLAALLNSNKVDPQVDPLVSLMMAEKVPDSTYVVGGLDKQTKEIKEPKSSTAYELIFWAQRCDFPPPGRELDLDDIATQHEPAAAGGEEGPVLRHVRAAGAAAGQEDFEFAVAKMFKHHEGKTSVKQAVLTLVRIGL